MNIAFSFLRKVGLMASLVGAASAMPLCVTTSGTFSISGTPQTSSALAARELMYDLGFTVDNHPLVSNVDSGGFDVAFSNFHISVNGTAENVTPDSIHFYRSSMAGLFTVYFGSQIVPGADQPLFPSLNFYGDAAYTGPESSPTILPGSYQVSEFLYTDDTYFADQTDPGTTVEIEQCSAMTETPEPATWGLSMMGLALAGVVAVLRGGQFASR